MPVHAYNHSILGKTQRNPDAHWPASLAKGKLSGSMRNLVSKTKVEMIEETPVTFLCPLFAHT